MMSRNFDLRNSVIRKNNVVKESVLEVFYLLLLSCCRYLVVASSEGFHVFEFLCQVQGPRNIQICVLDLLGEKNGAVSWFSLNSISFCMYVRKTSCIESVIFCGWMVL